MRNNAPLFQPADKCPDREKFHTPHPTTYLGHSVWMAQMSECHTQEKCPTCGLWAVWRDVDGNICLSDPIKQ